MRTQEWMINWLKNSPPLNHYKKFGTFTFEVHRGDPLEVVTSIGGQVETKNTAQNNDYILTGASGEVYVLKPETFAKRYKVTDTIPKEYLTPGEVLAGTAEATGECWGIEYQDEPQEFTANWGEAMIVNPGDYLVSPNEQLTEVYRIEKETFLKTYKPV